MFKELIGSTMEVYVDDMLVKSKKERDHLQDLGQAFYASLRDETESNEVYLWSSWGKVSRYLFSERGIEANLENLEAIMQLSSPKMIKEVQKLTGKIASLNRFIAKQLRKSFRRSSPGSENHKVRNPEGANFRQWSTISREEERGIVQGAENTTKLYSCRKPAGKWSNRGHEQDLAPTFKDKDRGRERITSRGATGGIVGISDDPKIRNWRNPILFGIWE
ncbi:UNVERIFIED_CONTAM: hypothetical protein Sradi_4388000 [Sesamum radiatum]|uniref:Reverse transcriptase domain-containing protein n=1 Tax=Sesamum radiatum TaxID=300843 RepID=A0AAW2NRI2_SESRA